MNTIALRTGWLSLGRFKVILDSLYLVFPASLSPVKANQSSDHSSTAVTSLVLSKIKSPKPKAQSPKPKAQSPKPKASGVKLAPGAFAFSYLLILLLDNTSEDKYRKRM